MLTLFSAATAASQPAAPTAAHSVYISSHLHHSVQSVGLKIDPALRHRCKNRWQLFFPPWQTNGSCPTCFIETRILPDRYEFAPTGAVAMSAWIQIIGRTKNKMKLFVGSAINKLNPGVEAQEILSSGTNCSMKSV